ncbi:MAG: flavodoxin family protein [Lachnospirales bacterium]
MKVLLLNGSPKSKGSTYTLLSEVEKALNSNGVETEIVHIGNNVTSGCMGCGFCGKNGKCVNDKDSLNPLLDKIKEADGYVFGSPVHYAAASGALTSFLDRLFIICGSAMAYKPACAAVACRRGGATAAVEQINKYFTINNMPVVSANYWNMAHGNNADEVKQDLEGMQIMRILGNNMAWLLKCIEAGKEKGIEPVKEAKIKFNYIR